MPILLTHRRTYWLAIILLMAAASLRLFELTRLPYGANPAEIGTIAQTLQARSGAVSLFLQTPDGAVEALYPSVMALVTLFFGDGLFGFRIIAPWLGLVAIALTLTLGIRLYGRLVGLVAAALLAFSFTPALLSRLFIVEQVLPLMVIVILLALARALPVYQQRRSSSTSIPAYAVLGFSLALSVYVNPIGLPMVVMAMLFIAYVMFAQRPLSRQQISLLGFALLLMMIVGIPYLLTNLRGSTFSSEWLLADFRGLGQSLAALFWQGSADATWHLPGAALLPPLWVALLVLGAAHSLRHARQPRYVLLWLSVLALLPYTLLRPDMRGIAPLLPVLALLGGLGVQALSDRLPQRVRPLGFLLLLGLGLFGLWRTPQELQDWRALPQVQTIYQTPLAQVARYLDQASSDLPTSFCYPQINAPISLDAIPPAALILLFVNNQSANVSLFDCMGGLLLREGGAPQRIILPTRESRSQLPRHLDAWFSLASPVTAPDLPPETVFEFDVREPLAQRLGEFTTTTPAQYPIESGEAAGLLVAPPVRFGGNLTWMGYVDDEGRVYQAGDMANIITYWRVDGEVPDDLMLFHHLLADPVTIASQRDQIIIAPQQLAPRDVFIQVTPVIITPTMLAGNYTVSIGAYQGQTGARLPVFDEQSIRRGDRLLLYAITVGGN